MRLIIPSLLFLAWIFPCSLHVIRIWDLRLSQESVVSEGSAVRIFCAISLWVEGLESMEVFILHILDLCLDWVWKMSALWSESLPMCFVIVVWVDVMREGCAQM